MKTESQRKKEGLRRFIAGVQNTIGLGNVPKFCEDIKDHSKYDNNEGKREHVIKKDFNDIIKYLGETIEPNEKKFDRLLNHINYDERDIMIAYYLIKNEKVVREIPEHFKDGFMQKLHDVDLFIKKWNQKIAMIHFMMGIIQSNLNNQNIQNDICNVVPENSPKNDAGNQEFQIIEQERTDVHDNQQFINSFQDIIDEGEIDDFISDFDFDL